LKRNERRKPPEGRDAGRQVTSDVMAMTTSCRRQGGSGRYGTDPTQRGREAAGGWRWRHESRGTGRAPFGRRAPGPPGRRMRREPTDPAALRPGAG